MALGKKYTLTNQMWIDAFNNIENTISREQIHEKVQDTVGRLQRVIQGKKVAFAWSGGKDSIALQYICERAGVDMSMWGTSDLEYPEFRKWCEKNKPLNCEEVNTGLDLAWLAKHTNYLFPESAKEDVRWFPLIQWKAQLDYYKKHQLDMILTGRRLIDNNFCGKEGLSISKEKTTYNPLYDWSHEEVLAVIKYYYLELPPTYWWYEGWYEGTHCWAQRNKEGRTEQEMWKIIYDLDKSIVLNAANYLSGAREFLSKL